MDTLTLTPPEILQAPELSRPSAPKPATKAWQLKALRFFFRRMGPYLPYLAARLTLYFFTTPKKRRPAPELPPLFQTANAFDLPFDQGRLKVYTWGIFGPRVLLVHGWESQAITFRQLIPKLLDQGYRVVAFDGPAHGQSSGRQTTFPQFARSVEAVMDYFSYSGGISYLIGHSFGAYTSSFLLSESPGLAPLKKVVAISMPTQVSMATDNLFDSLQVPPKVQRLFHQKLEALAGRRMADYNMDDRFEMINANEVLLVHDVNDEMIPLPERCKQQSDSEKVKCLITDGFGHYRIIKDPLVIDRMIRFLNS